MNTYKESSMTRRELFREEIEATACIGWAGLKHKTTKDRGRGTTMVSFRLSSLHRHDDDKGLENGET